MFNLDKVIRRWREDLERRSSRLPREPDELEDHPRARFEPGMGFGCSAWVASFFCVATALWMRAREMKPATPEPTGAR